MSRVLPILFNADMVQAILDGRKTVTRRVIKHNIDAILNSPYHKEHPETPDKMIIEKLCMPPYQPGDILYVRETWAFQCCIECMMNICEDDSCMIGKTSTIYEDRDAISEGCYIYRVDHPHAERIIWHPSIHMPKEAARIWLKVADMRVERLQEITIDGIRSEGLPSMAVHVGDMEIALEEWKLLWNSTLKKSDLERYGWDANPWVRVIEFEQCEKPEPCILKGMEPAENKRPCIGYAVSDIDDEPCEMCKGCKKCTGNL